MYVHPTRQAYPGLMLCACGHVKAQHHPRPLYYLPPQGDSQGQHAPEGSGCAHCSCASYVQGEYQGLCMLQAGHDEASRK